MKISVQTGGLIEELGVENCYRAIAEAGFEAIDWNIDHSLRPALINAGNCEGNCIFEKDMEEILDYYSEELFHIKKNGLEITQAHAPFPAYVIDKPYVLDYMIKIYKKMTDGSEVRSDPSFPHSLPAGTYFVYTCLFCWTFDGQPGVK